MELCQRFSVENHNFLWISASVVPDRPQLIAPHSSPQPRFYIGRLQDAIALHHLSNSQIQTFLMQ